ncbi:unnamed protein product [Brassica napus]|uniref:(rape) hypothetical protein n=1 Tax=Brassica napus TaxID=3708 RepID=A0A817B4E1_BRANA|nr:unnamed protein product [Brassica napus]
MKRYIHFFSFSLRYFLVQYASLQQSSVHVAISGRFSSFREQHSESFRDDGNDAEVWL